MAERNQSNRQQGQQQQNAGTRRGENVEQKAGNSNQGQNQGRQSNQQNRGNQGQRP